MQKRTSFWQISELRQKIHQVSFPEYQREPSIWHRSAKQRLIDSIVRKFDISLRSTSTPTATTRGTASMADSGSRPSCRS